MAYPAKSLQRILAKKFKPHAHVKKNSNNS